MNITESDPVVALLGDRIKQRSENVALNAEQRRAKREKNASATENSDYFYDNFAILKNNVQKKLEEANSVDKLGIIEYLDSLVSDVSKMQAFLNESSMFLPSFQIKTAQENINLTSDLVQECIKRLQPKKKFGFKNKKNESVKPTQSKYADAVDCKVTSSSASASLTEELREKMFFGFKDITGETLIKTADQLKNRQLNLLNLTSCKVIALGNPGSLQFANLKDTTVVVGPTSRSAFIKDCNNCTFVLACQQVRIHNTEDTKFYLHVTSAAIIENCRRVSFGPYTLQYDGQDEHYTESQLSQNINNWKNIDDFHWINENEKSPNFSLLDENEWERDWNLDY